MRLRLFLFIILPLELKNSPVVSIYQKEVSFKGRTPIAKRLRFVCPELQ